MPEHKELEKSISTIKQLKEHAALAPDEEKRLERVGQVHPMRVSPYYVSLTNWNDPDDPIRKMAVPSVEKLNLEGFYDTSGEAETSENAKQGNRDCYDETIKDY